ncbi:MAG: Gfo/Idh/MocA family oxidoreductase, partial [Candidatus Hydrogenedentes bacterium]|nr:Gfo/Idh/MocA family oxidoreductase [Candidatus Hydrogenedentota bacterium]
MKPVNIGIVGCGNICDRYFASGKRFEILNLAACADLILERAKDKAAQFDVPKACTTEELLADPDIEIVINLTVPRAHGEIGIAALEAGKSVHTEKPLAVTREDGLKMLELARQKGLRVGGAPDTFMGGGLQTCRKLIDDGWIGRPVSATAFMQCHGHENWHPDPTFYYQPGGGPMFDMGPYHLTALIALLGPIRRVCGSTGTAFPQRTITSEPKYGTVMNVEVPTHIAGIMDFANGAIGTMIMSFDVWAHCLPCIEIHGTEGSLAVPDPNGFGGAPKVKRGREGDWKEVPLSHEYANDCR